MLVIDDDMLKLAKMQERLLKATESDREKNLANYKKTVMQIDSEAFASLLDKVKHIGDHNHSLEEELQFLNAIKEAYEQLRELQLGFIDVCNTYGDSNLKLSDLSQLDIEYINDRISTINGYLLNVRNIEINKNKLQSLNEQLVEEEKKKDYLSSKLSQMELDLIESFRTAEGRKLSDGNLQYTSVIDEYKSIGIDFSAVLGDASELRKMLFNVERERSEVGEKFRAAEICYNNFPNADSKQILDEIRKDYIKIKYKYAMLKMLDLLSVTCISYDTFKEKREKILDLIRYRYSCLESLGVKISIDPFSRTKTRGQLDVLLSLTDNSKVINKIKKELSHLSVRTEEMINQNIGYKKALADTKELLISRVSMGSIDISSVELPFEDDLVITRLEPEKVPEENQVVGVRTPSTSLNMSIISQKTINVLKRVSQMITRPSVSVIEEKKTVSSAAPELVIVPSVDLSDKRTDDESVSFDIEDIFVSPISVQQDEDELVEETPVRDTPIKKDDIFETVIPFGEPIMFEAKSDDSLEPETKEKSKPLDFVATESEPLEIVSTSSGVQLTSLEPETPSMETELDSLESGEEMPDAFWVTEDTGLDEEDDENEAVLSFDDQINILLSEEANVKSRKLEVDRNTSRAA